MAKATFIRNGEVMTVTNSGDTAIEVGDIVSLGTRIGVSADTIQPGDAGSVNVVGVFSLPKVGNLAINQGDAVYFVPADGVVSKTASGNIPAGYAAASAAAADETVQIKLLG